MEVYHIYRYLPGFLSGPLVHNVLFLVVIVQLHYIAVLYCSEAGSVGSDAGGIH